MAVRRATIAAAALTALVALLAYLRDPPWLIHVSSGFRAWRVDGAGLRYRTMTGHGSFFIPADATAVTLAVSAPFDSPSDWPITATFFVDDKPADRLVLDDDGWHTLTIRLGQPATRRVRRIDIRTDRTRSGNRGLLVSEPQLTAPTRNDAGAKKAAPQPHAPGVR